jgi:hypothetical protein
MSQKELRVLEHKADAAHTEIRVVFLGLRKERQRLVAAGIECTDNNGMGWWDRSEDGS